MAGSDQVASGATPKPPRGRKPIVPVIPAIPNTPLSRKERRKSKQHGNAAEGAPASPANEHPGKEVGEIKDAQAASEENTSSQSAGNINTGVEASKFLQQDTEQSLRGEGLESTEGTLIEDLPPKDKHSPQSSTIPQATSSDTISPSDLTHQDTPQQDTTAQNMPPQDISLEEMARQGALAEDTFPKATAPKETVKEDSATKEIDLMHSATDVGKSACIIFGKQTASVSSDIPPNQPGNQYQHTSIQHPMHHSNFHSGTVYPSVTRVPALPLEIGYQTSPAHTSPIHYPYVGSSTHNMIPHLYNPNAVCFQPPENHSPYSPVETPSGLKSEPWSAPNQSATSNSSVEADGKQESKITSSTAAVPTTPGIIVEQHKNQIMDVVTTAEVIPIQKELGSTEDEREIEQDDEDDGIPSLPNYLLNLFHSGQYTDWTLVIASTVSTFETSPVYVHGLLAARSPFLRSQMEAHYATPNGINIIVLNSSHRFLRPHPFQCAVQRLYGDNLLTADLTKHFTVAFPADASSSAFLKPQMEFAFGYSVAGNLLQLPGVERRGLKLATEFVEWSTLETALSFELAGDVKSWVKTNDDFHQHAISPRSGVSRRSSSITDNTPHSAHQAYDGQRLLEVSSGSLAGAPFANEVSKAALTFLVSHFPADFKLETGVTALDMPDRLPFTEDLRSPKARLHSIRFGELPTLEETRSSIETKIASRILLTVPFEMLEVLLGKLKGKLDKALAIAVVQEREKRRLRVLNSKPEPDKSWVKDSDWYALGWEEKIKDGEGDEFELTRTPKGVQESSDK